MTLRPERPSDALRILTRDELLLVIDKMMDHWAAEMCRYFGSGIDFEHQRRLALWAWDAMAARMAAVRKAEDEAFNAWASCSALPRSPSQHRQYATAVERRDRTRAALARLEKGRNLLERGGKS